VGNEAILLWANSPYRKRQFRSHDRHTQITQPHLDHSGAYDGPETTQVRKDADKK